MNIFHNLCQIFGIGHVCKIWCPSTNEIAFSTSSTVIELQLERVFSSIIKFFNIFSPLFCYYSFVYYFHLPMQVKQNIYPRLNECQFWLILILVMSQYIFHEETIVHLFLHFKFNIEYILRQRIFCLKNSKISPILRQQRLETRSLLNKEFLRFGRILFIFSINKFYLFFFFLSLDFMSRNLAFIISCIFLFCACLYLPISLSFVLSSVNFDTCFMQSFFFCFNCDFQCNNRCKKTHGLSQKILLHYLMKSQRKIHIQFTTQTRNYY